MTLRVVQFGCGAIGCNIVRLALQKANFEIVGAIDLTNIGRDLGDVAGLGKKLGVTISEDTSAVLNAVTPNAVLHATGSNLANVYPQLEKIIESGSDIVSTCEELSYPYRKHPALATKIDKLAKRHGVWESNVNVLTDDDPDVCNKLNGGWPLKTALCKIYKA